MDASPRCLGSGGARGSVRSPLARPAASFQSAARLTARVARGSRRSPLAIGGLASLDLPLPIRPLGGAPVGRAARSLRASLTARGVAARRSGGLPPVGRPVAPVLVPLDSRRSSSDVCSRPSAARTARGALRRAVRLALLGSPSPSVPERVAGGAGNRRSSRRRRDAAGPLRSPARYECPICRNGSLSPVSRAV